MRIYLDTWVWIDLLDVHTGRKSNRSLSETLVVLQEKIRNRSCFTSSKSFSLYRGIEVERAREKKRSVAFYDGTLAMYWN